MKTMSWALYSSLKVGDFIVCPDDETLVDEALVLAIDLKSKTEKRLVIVKLLSSKNGGIKTVLRFSDERIFFSKIISRGGSSHQ
jgi:hypothetical protein